MAAVAPQPGRRRSLGRTLTSESPRTVADLTLKAARGPPGKSLGEFSSLPHHYDGSHRPARMGLRRVLASGQMRNPMEMTQSGILHWSLRPSTADSAPSRPRSGSRAGAPRAAGERPPVPSASGAAGALALGATAGEALAGQAPSRGAEPLRPQRIELPSYLNTPVRRPDGEPLSDQEHTVALKKVQDLELLTQACRRASKGKDEGRAHFSLGVLRDNLGQYQKAIESYNQFLRVCKECNDAQGCGLAYHCIGVDYQLLAGGGVGGAGGGRPGSACRGHGGESGEVKPELLRKAISFHNKHREGADSVGKFVAHLNSGLAYALLGEKEASTVNHQYALRYALQLHSLEGQSLAIGSLGFSRGMYDHDAGKMSVLIERYVELCGALKQPRNQASALQRLGALAGQRGDNEQSASYFQQAMEHAREHGDLETELDCSVQLGVAKGQAGMEDYLGEILERAIVHGRGRA